MKLRKLNEWIDDKGQFHRDEDYDEQEEGKCPFCGSYDIEYGDLHIDNTEEAHYDCTCKECGKEYDECHTIVLEFYTNRVKN